MKTYRILPDDEISRHLYWTFEDRVRAFLLKYEPEINAEIAIAMIRQKWVLAPDDTGYWIGIEGSSAGAHLVAFVDRELDRPYVNFWQIRIEEGAHDVMAEVGREIAAWVAFYNQKLAMAGLKPITHGQSHTWLPPAVYERLFRSSGLAPKPYRTIFRWSIV